MDGRFNDVLHYPGAPQPQRGAWTHWGSWFPESKGDLKEKGGCVEVCQTAHYLNWRGSQPSIMLHELSHAYHYHNNSIETVGFQTLGAGPLSSTILFSVRIPSLYASLK